MASELGRGVCWNPGIEEGMQKVEPFGPVDGVFVDHQGRSCTTKPREPKQQNQVQQKKSKCGEFSRHPLNEKLCMEIPSEYDFVPPRSDAVDFPTSLNWTDFQVENLRS